MFDSRNISLRTLTCLALLSLCSATHAANDDKLRIICFGAHPDDAEYKNRATAALWAAQGHHAQLVSVTNGDIGYWQVAGRALAQRRTAESTLDAKPLGVTSLVLDTRDGKLLPTRRLHSQKHAAHS